LGKRDETEDFAGRCKNVFMALIDLSVLLIAFRRAELRVVRQQSNTEKMSVLSKELVGSVGFQRIDCSCSYYRICHLSVTSLRFNAIPSAPVNHIVNVVTHFKVCSVHTLIFKFHYN